MGVGGNFGMRRPGLRERRPVRADHRLRADEKRIRAQSAILDDSKTKPLSLLSKTVFLVRMRFSSVPKTGFARGAHNRRSWIKATPSRDFRPYARRRRPHLRAVYNETFNLSKP
jgi:hypothetical protein